MGLSHLVLRKSTVICIELLLHLVLPFCPSQAVSRQITLEQQLQTMRETDHMLQVLQESLGDLDRQLTSYLTDRIDAFQMPQEAQVFLYSSSLQNFWKYFMIVLSLDLVINFSPVLVHQVLSFVIWSGFF